MPPAAEQPKERLLTDIQRASLDCSACFTVQDKAVDASQVAACRSLSINTARKALSALEGYGVLTNVSTEGTRTNRYQPTAEGMAMASADLNPWECRVSTDETPRPLPPALQRALGCVTCLEANSETVTRGIIAACTGQSTDTATYALRELTKRGAISAAVTAPTQVVYTLAENTKTPAITEPCDTIIAKREAAGVLTTTEQAALDCFRCQASQERIPTRRQMGECTSMDYVQTRRVAGRLEERGLISPIEGPKPGLTSTKRSVGYQLATRVTCEPQRQAGCQTEEALVAYRKLSPDRQKALGCMVCIATKITRGAPLPGVSTTLIAHCAGIPESTASAFTAALEAQGYVTSKSGYNLTGLGGTFTVPTLRGEKLYAIHREQAGESIPSDCKNDLESLRKVPIHIRDSILRCLGCIWTQQAASGQELCATPRILGGCTRLSSDNLRQRILPQLVQEGYLEMVPGRSSARHSYRPADHSRALFGYAPDCGTREQADKKTVRQLSERLPDEAVRPDDNHAFEAFQEFVSVLGQAPDMQDVYGEALAGRLRDRHPLLTAEEEVHLATIIQTSDDQKLVERAKESFIVHNVRLTKWMAQQMRFETSITSFEDVAQAALIGVAKAVEVFDPLRGIKFSTLAYWRMRHHVQQATAEACGVPRPIIIQAPITMWQKNEYQREHGRAPTPIELALALNKPLATVKRTLAGIEYIFSNVKRLDAAPFHNSDKSLHEIEGAVDSNYAEVETRTLFRKLQPHLTTFENEMLESIFIRREKTIDDYEGSHAKYVFEQLSELLQHPYFGIHAELTDTGWQNQAHCMTHPDGIFATEIQHHPTADQISSICGSCIVRRECFEYAQEHNIHSGIWGGVSARSFT